jgi:germination protein M
VIKHRVSAGLWVIVILTVLLLAVIGCNTGEDVLPPGNGEDKDNPQVDGETVQVALYFAEAKAVNSGEPGEYGFVAPVFRSVAAGEDLLMAALAELIRGPKPEDGNFFSTVPVTTKILGVQVDGEVVYIDFSHELLSDSPGGTLGGTVFMQSIVFTVTQLPGVEKVAVLVEGDPWCDGHSFWDEPLGPADVVYGIEDDCCGA